MSTTYQTPQEAFWAGSFGDEYISRNCGAGIVAANTAFFGDVLHTTNGLESVVELGANIGNNLVALRHLLPQTEISAVEINPHACDKLREMSDVVNHVIESSILEWQPTKQYDLTFTKGVLIHINPEALPKVYDQLFHASRRWVLVAEYYNPVPVQLPYRGHDERLFKRDFAGELMKRHPSLKMRRYGFLSRHDPVFPQDDINWFLMEKA